MSSYDAVQASTTTSAVFSVSSLPLDCPCCAQAFHAKGGKRRARRGKRATCTASMRADTRAALCSVAPTVVACVDATGGEADESSGAGDTGERRG